MKRTRLKTKPLSRAAAMADIAGGQAPRVVRAMLSLALYDEDGMLAGKICLKHLSHSDERIRGGAVRALGYVAAVHGCLDDAVLVPALDRALQDSSEFVRQEACCAMDAVLGVAGFADTGE